MEEARLSPHARKVGQLRSAMLRAMTQADMRAIVAKLVELAKGGNVQAAKELIDRCIGRPVEADLIARIEELEFLMRDKE